MSNYIHPMQEQYNLKISEILHKHHHNPYIQLNSFISLLTQYQIKFFSKDDVSKFSKLCNPFDKLNINQAFIHLELIYVHLSMEVKYFVVKFTGKMFKTLNIKPLQIKKHEEIHSLQLCINDFKRKMGKLHGKQNFWFRALGGIVGRNTIKKQQFCKKINKIFSNTCHSVCIHRFIDYVCQGNTDQIIWQKLRQKINMNLITIKLDSQISPNKSLQLASSNSGIILPQLKVCHQKCFRITTLTKLQNLAVSQHIKPTNTSINGQLQLNLLGNENSKCYEVTSPPKQQRRRRLKTIAGKPRYAMQSCNLPTQIKRNISVKGNINLYPNISSNLNQNINTNTNTNEDIIHSKNRYKRSNSNKKCKTSLDQY